MKRSEIARRARARKIDGVVALRWGYSCSTYRRMSLSQFIKEFGAQMENCYSDFYSIFDSESLDERRISTLFTGDDSDDKQIGIELGHFVFNSSLDGYVYLEKFGNKSFVSYNV